MIINKLSFRERKVLFFYNYYLQNLTKNEALKYLINEKELKFSIDQIEKVEDIFNYLSIIEKHLLNQLGKNKWDDIHFLEKSILLNAIYELTILKIKKEIIIKEYVLLTKKYGSSENSYKFINSFLDK